MGNAYYKPGHSLEKGQRLLLRVSIFIVLLFSVRSVHAVKGLSVPMLRYWRNDPCWGLVIARSYSDFRVGEEIIDSRTSEVSKKLNQLAGESSNLRRLARLKARLKRRPIADLNDTPVFTYLNYIDHDAFELWQALKQQDFRIEMLSLKDVSELDQNVEFFPATVDFDRRRILMNFLVNDYDPWLESLEAEDVIDPEVVLVEKMTEAIFLLNTLEKDEDGDEIRIKADFLSYLEGLTRNIPELPTLLQGTSDEGVLWEMHYYFLHRAAAEAGFNHYKKRLNGRFPAYSATYEWVDSRPLHKRYDLLLERQYQIAPLYSKVLGGERKFREWARPNRP